MSAPRFALNRFDVTSVEAFAQDVRRAEEHGWDGAFLPDSQLRRRDTYVLLAAAAQASSEITIGPLLTNPVTRHPSVTASSIATIDELAPGRTLLGWGIGDTAVRLAGLRPMAFAGTDFEFPRPSKTSVIGFLLSSLVVAGMIGGFVWLMA